MDYTRALIGGPTFPRALAIGLVITTAILSFGWVALFAAIENSVPESVGLFVWLGIPAFVSVAAAGAVAFEGEGILFGWLVGAASFFGIVTVLGHDASQKTGEWTIEAVLLGGVMWSSILALLFGVVGLVLGGGFRLLSSRGELP